MYTGTDLDVCTYSQSVCLSVCLSVLRQTLGSVRATPLVCSEYERRLLCVVFSSKHSLATCTMLRTCGGVYRKGSI